MSTIELNRYLLEYQNPLSFFALKLTADEDDAKDLLQETMLRSLKYKDKLQANTSIKAWLYTIMKNTFINQYRRSVKLNQIVGTMQHQGYVSTASSALSISPEKGINLEDMNAEIRNLSDEYRIPFQMKLEGFKYKEIGEHLGIPIGTVKSRIFLARKELMVKLKDFNPHV